jgi:3-dehydroshikimate dehydratase
MLFPGLVSITLRQLSSQEIVDIVVEAGLAGIEWGGDVHVPHGNFAKAREVRKCTEGANLKVAAYGSYYFAGHKNSESFEKILETAVELNSPIIRVWAGKQGSSDSTERYRQEVIEDCRRIADLAGSANIRIASEWHPNTLTDTMESAKALLEAIDHDNFYTYWQPPKFMPVENCLEQLEAAKPWLTGLHVFSWDRETAQRLPMARHSHEWKLYLAKAASVGEMFALLEFVENDDPNVFLRDAETLKLCLKEFLLL